MIADFWRPIGETAWRRVSDDPPTPGETVEWLDRRRGEGEAAYQLRADQEWPASAAAPVP